jgi:metal-sulfur cluster biosynthetic enzyme/ribosomal protein L22
MSTTLTAEWHVDEPQLRVTQRDAQTALRVIVGQPVVAARARLRLGPGRTCEPVARLLDRAIVQAEDAGLDPKRLVVADGSAQAAEDIIRVRRKAHGVADWIHSPTCRVRIILRPAGLYAAARADLSQPPGPAETAAALPAATTPPTALGPPAPPAPPAPLGPPAPPAPPADERAAAVYEALSDVIDPDLGVNIVDLGFVRAVEIRDQTAVITMTLTSAACPLSRIMEDQIRTGLAPLDRLSGFRVDWQWVPAWRPADITDSGREQLRAIGFSFKD